MNDRVMSADYDVTKQGVASLYNKGLFPRNGQVTSTSTYGKIGKTYRLYVSPDGHSSSDDIETIVGRKTETIRNPPHRPETQALQIDRESKSNQSSLRQDFTQSVRDIPIDKGSANSAEPDSRECTDREIAMLPV